MRVNGLAIKTAREVLGWTQQRLAIETGIYPNTICMIERGRGGPLLGIGSADKIAKALNIPLETILTSD